MNRRPLSLMTGMLLGLATAAVQPQERPPAFHPPINLFVEAASTDQAVAEAALESLARAWRDTYTPLIIDLARFMRPTRASSPGESTGPADVVGRVPDDTRPGGPPAPGREVGRSVPVPRDPSAIVRGRLVGFLEEQTGQRFGDDLDRWRQWMWQLPYEPHPEYAAFKGALYSRVDPAMQRFFPPNVQSAIRLDEIDWGGVGVNGIPPLDHPAVLPARDAQFLKGDHVVFGIERHGEARAYPKRILAWHELALDRLGGDELTIVYCTLCGTVIPYESRVGGRLRRFGTSGLLYRSNKLLFDQETGSLWSTFEGKPVVGPLVGSGLHLRPWAVVTTTWAEWKTQHPETTVLSLDTGYRRDYSEGAAYRSYFGSDRLMFQVPQTDDQLRNKAEVLVMLLESGRTRQPVAISAEFLRANPVYHLEAGGHRLVVVTSPEGANRVYAAGPFRFIRRAGLTHVQDQAGRQWRITEVALVPPEGAEPLPRIPAQRAFWFGWFAQFPGTILIK